jgi:hypothetical protein
MVFTYTNNATNTTYVLNQTMMDMASAERMCNLAGGHLAAWLSLDEQVCLAGLSHWCGIQCCGTHSRS